MKCEFLVLFICPGFPWKLDGLINNVQTEAKEKYVALVAQLKEKHGVKE